jgi:DNA-binding NtrC family response regulator
VTEPKDRPSILIADEDVGFVWWLGELFNEAGYPAIPALNADQAIAFLEKSAGSIIVLVVGANFKDIDRLVQVLVRFGSPKLVLIQDSAGQEIAGVRAAAALERPDGWTPISRVEWRFKIKKILNEVGVRAAS